MAPGCWCQCKALGCGRTVKGGAALCSTLFAAILAWSTALLRQRLHCVADTLSWAELLLQRRRVRLHAKLVGVRVDNTNTRARYPQASRQQQSDRAYLTHGSAPPPPARTPYQTPHHEVGDGVLGRLGQAQVRRPDRRHVPGLPRQQPQRQQLERNHH